MADMLRCVVWCATGGAAGASRLLHLRPSVHECGQAVCALHDPRRPDQGHVHTHRRPPPRLGEAQPGVVGNG